MILFTSFILGFFYLLCLRLDGYVEVSMFVILIPFWLFVVYVCAYVLLLGLASTNPRVNKCERILLAVCLPIGFLTSVVLGFCIIEGLIDMKVYFVFIPTMVSFVFMYLYVRCLVKPSMGSSRVHNEGQFSKQH